MYGLRNKLKRLEALERKYVHRPLYVIAELDGNETEMTAQHCIDSGAVFLKVAHGNNLRDLDKLLNVMYEAAMREKE